MELPSQLELDPWPALRAELRRSVGQDVYEIWLVPGSVQHVLNFIQAHVPTGSVDGTGSESGSSSGSSKSSNPPLDTVDQATWTFVYPPRRGTTPTRA